ncbi:MAG: hypothetical protein ACYC5N_08010 [Endomicrobiales bacterium]
MFRNIKNLIGRKLQAADGDIGTVKSFLLDDKKWVARYMVAETGQLSKKRVVLIPPESIIQTSLESGVFVVNLTRGQVNNSPEVDLSVPVARQAEVRIADYYGVPRPRGAGGERPAGAVVAEKGLEYTLVNTEKLLDATVAAADGEAGSVDDLIVDDGSWDLRSVVVDVLGRKVEVPARHIAGFDPQISELRADLSLSEIRDRPEYAP